MAVVAACEARLESSKSSGTVGGALCCVCCVHRAPAVLAVPLAVTQYCMPARALLWMVVVLS